MKRYIFIFLIALGACQEEEQMETLVAKPQTNAILQPGYTEFLQYAEQYEVKIDTTVALEFGTCDCHDHQYQFVPTTPSDNNLAFHVYHALGHALLHKDDTDDASIMNPLYAGQWGEKREQLIQDLFTK